MMDSDGPFNNLYYLKHFECAKGKNNVYSQPIITQ